MITVKHKLLLDSDETLFQQMLAEISDLFPNVNSKEKLWSLTQKHIDLIPILSKYIATFQTNNYKDFCVRAMGVKGFNKAIPFLLEEFYKSDNISYKWTIGNSIEIIKDTKYVDQFIEIISNIDHGISRQMVILALGKIKSEKALKVFINLLDDEEVNGHVIMALGNYKNVELIKHIEPFLGHNLSWKRKEAKKAINRIHNNQKDLSD